MFPQVSKKLLALFTGSQLPCGSKRIVPLTVVWRVKSLSAQIPPSPLVLKQTQCSLISTSVPSGQTDPLGQDTLISNWDLGTAAPTGVRLTPVSNNGNTKTLPGSASAKGPVAKACVTSAMASRQKKTARCFKLLRIFFLHTEFSFFNSFFRVCREFSENTSHFI